MFINKQQYSKKIKINFLEIFKLTYKLYMPDKRLIALINVKRKVRALQGHSAR